MFHQKDKPQKPNLGQIVYIRKASKEKRKLKKRHEVPSEVKGAQQSQPEVGESSKDANKLLLELVLLMP